MTVKISCFVGFIPATGYWFAEVTDGFGWDVNSIAVNGCLSRKEAIASMVKALRRLGISGSLKVEG